MNHYDDNSTTLAEMDIVPCGSCSSRYHSSPDPSCGECDGLGYHAGESRYSQGTVERVKAALTGVLHAIAVIANRIDRLPSAASFEDAVESKKRELEEGAKSAQGYWDSLHQSNHHLRAEVKSLRRIVTEKLTAEERRESEPKSLLRNPQVSEVARGIRLMVNTELKHALGDEAFGPETLRGYIRDLLKGQMDNAIQKMAGITSYGEIRSGPLKEQLDGLLKPAIDEAVKEVIPKAIDDLDLPRTLTEWQEKELRDLFARELHEAMRKKAIARAEEIASQAVTENVDGILAEEFPFLKRYLAMERLGASNGD